MKAATDGHDAGISDFIIAELKVSSPRKLSILVVQNYIHRIKASQKHFILFWKENHWLAFLTSKLWQQIPYDLPFNQSRFSSVF